MSRGSSSARIGALDTFRGVASLSVTLWHFTGFEAFDGTVWQLPCGYLGLDLFFVISGFVIFMTLDNCRRVLDFAFGRFIRLYPTYVLCCLVVFGCMRIFPDYAPEKTWQNLLLSLTMLGEYWAVSIESFDFVITSAWTLSLEITFYAFMGLLFACNQLRFIRWYMAVWMLAQVLVDELVKNSSVAYNLLYTFLNFQYAHLFCVGMCFYLLFRRYGGHPQSGPAVVPPSGDGWAARPEAGEEEPLIKTREDAMETKPRLPTLRTLGRELREIWPELCLLVVAFCIAVWVKTPWGVVTRTYPHWRAVNALFCLITYGLFTLVICMSRWRDTSRIIMITARILEFPVPVYFGTISYTLYLIHEEIGSFVFIYGFHGDLSKGLPPGFGIEPLSAGATIFLTLLFALIMATAITYLFEKPTMNWLKAWYKSWTTPLQTPTQPKDDPFADTYSLAEQQPTP